MILNLSLSKYIICQITSGNSMWGQILLFVSEFVCKYENKSQPDAGAGTGYDP